MAQRGAEHPRGHPTARRARSAAASLHRTATNDQHAFCMHCHPPLRLAAHGSLSLSVPLSLSRHSRRSICKESLFGREVVSFSRRSKTWSPHIQRCSRCPSPGPSCRSSTAPSLPPPRHHAPQISPAPRPSSVLSSSSRLG
jgi:hypothetical protein